MPQSGLTLAAVHEQEIPRRHWSAAFGADQRYDTSGNIVDHASRSYYFEIYRKDGFMQSLFKLLARLLESCRAAAKSLPDLSSRVATDLHFGRLR